MSAVLAHVRVELALHRLREGAGHPLLLLHGLGEASTVFGDGPDWPGPVYALDFAGHGGSAAMRGGVYYPELAAADADQALARLGEAALIGRGLGAYAALLLAGARPEAVSATVLLPGPGLEGTDRPEWPEARDLAVELAAAHVAGDHAAAPRLGVEISLRPVDYVHEFAAAARSLVFVGRPDPEPPWWRSARGAACARGATSLEEALAAIRPAA